MVEKRVTKMSPGAEPVFGNVNAISPMQGVTLVELLVVIAIIGILIAVGMTGMRPGPTKVKSAALNFRSHLMLAKSEAIKRNLEFNVVIDVGNGTYAATDDDGDTVFSGAFDTGVSITTSNISITFKPLGTASTSSFHIGGAGANYTVSVNSVGKITVQ